MEASKKDKEKQTHEIEATENRPYIVSNLNNFKNSKEEAIETNPIIALCRCGKSQNKPFCDGTHWHILFRDKKTKKRCTQ